MINSVSVNSPWILSITQDQSALSTKQKEHEKLDKALKKLQDYTQQDQEAHSAAQKHFHAVSAGLSSNQDGEDASLNEQLMSEYWLELSVCAMFAAKIRVVYTKRVTLSQFETPKIR